MKWTKDMDLKLTVLWSAHPALSATEIGRQLGVSKNSAIGRVHRLDLSQRPNPIKRGRGNAPPKPKRAAKVTLAIAPAAPVVTPSAPIASAGRCCWPLWNNAERPTHRYCDAAVSRERSYCDTHRAIAYMHAAEPVVRLPGSFGFGAAA